MELVGFFFKLQRQKKKKPTRMKRKKTHQFFLHEKLLKQNMNKPAVTFMKHITNV